MYFLKRSIFASKSPFCRNMETLVSTQWLADRLAAGDSNTRVVHASLNNCADYEKGHISTAVCMNLDECRDKDSKYKNMLPKPDMFARYVGEKLGISNSTNIVVYDSNTDAPSLFPAARAWFMFRVFGHDKVAILNGGLYKWMEEKRTVCRESCQVQPASFKAEFRQNLVLSFENVMDRVVKQNALQLLDARSAQRFVGSATDAPRESGHIPNSLNVFFGSLVDRQTKLVKDPKQLKELYETQGVNLSKSVGASCGTGVTACAVALGAYLLDKKDVAVYDGSWYEWTRRIPDDSYIKKG